MGTFDRGVSSVVAVVLLVALTVVLAGTVLLNFGPVTGGLHEPSLAVVSAEQTTIEDATHIDENECSNLSGHRELAVEVTLRQLHQADVIYVIVASEGGEEKKVLWADPSSSNVGETLTLANEVTASDAVDVDIGKPSGSDTAYCPGESATFSIYAEYDDRTSLLQEFEF